MKLPIRIPLRQEGLLSRWLNRSSVRALVLRADGFVAVERADGAVDESRPHPETAIYSGLVILRLVLQEKTVSLVLHEGMTGRDAHRRLRVWLKTRKAGG